MSTQKLITPQLWFSLSIMMIHTSSRNHTMICMKPLLQHITLMNTTTSQRAITTQFIIMITTLHTTSMILTLTMNRMRPTQFCMMNHTVLSYTILMHSHSFTTSSDMKPQPIMAMLMSTTISFAMDMASR